METERTRTAAEFATLVYSGNLSDEEEKSLQDWLGDSSDNLSEYNKVLDVWHSVGALSGKLEELPVEEDKPGAVGYGFSSLARWAIAATVLVAAGVVWFVYQDRHLSTELSPPSAIAHYETSTGEQQTRTLPDGSTITLNTNTRLLVDFNDQERQIILKQGEVFFDIASDPLRPFSIDTGQNSVTVLGTKFNVRKAGLTLIVAVVEGLVAVHNPEIKADVVGVASELSPGQAVLSAMAGSYRLKAGLTASFSGRLGSEGAVVNTTTLNQGNQQLSWRNGQLRFVDRPLTEVVKELNRYAKKKILIEDMRIMDLKVSGIFKVDKIDLVLKRFEEALPVTTTQYPDRIVLVARDK